MMTISPPIDFQLPDGEVSGYELDVPSLSKLRVERGLLWNDGTAAMAFA